ncbi:TolC family protein [Mucilaginibacter robiniae]|uniref:TolC family protein n=1 Tax=Mucilaginibacter robiniae TaxID=2728022 RepID=A0A7L5E0I1_9SPHI|nr:TolC family protein [Mucilaginibacter robiniae]QJD96008.1 TolC family protein [Mucilaginibacter robiniae]
MRYLLIFFILMYLFSGSLKAQSKLDDFLELSYTNSPLLNEARNQQVVNQAEAERIRALTTKLQLSLNANYLFAPVYITDAGHKGFDLNAGGAVNYYGYDLGTTNGGSLQGLLVTNQPLFAGRRAGILAAQSLVNVQIYQNTVQLTRHDLEKAITDQYMLCLLDKKQVGNSMANMKIIDQQRLIVKKLVNASLLKNSDLILLNIEYENNQNILLAYQAAYHKDLLELRIMSGSRDTAEVELAPLELKLKTPVDRSAYLERFRLDSLGLVATQNAFETKYRLQISVFGNTGLNATHFNNLYDRFGLGAGLSLTWSILDGHQKEITRRKTTLQLQSVAFNKSNAQLQNDLRKKQALDELMSYDGRVKNQQKQLAEYESLLTSYRTQVIQAQLSVIDFINVLKNRTIAQRDLLQLETNRNLLINAYNYWNW